MSVDGAVLFARYAFPPNELGYCGPDDAAGLLELAHEAVPDGELRHLARQFEGAWPYLELLAGTAGVEDPLDRRVVRAYWLGAPLARPSLGELGRSVDDRFRARAGRSWDRLAAALAPGATVSHAFHVLCVGPWVGLLRQGLVDEPLETADRCRIRWGTVTAVHGEVCTVRSRPLVLDRGRLVLGPAVDEEVATARAGTTLGPAVSVGDQVSCHWGWVCDVLTAAERGWLAACTRQNVALANAQLGADRSPRPT